MKPIVALCLLAFGSAGAQDTVLGPLNAPGQFDRSTYSTYIAYNSIDLASQPYYVRLPANYNPAKSYGLIAFADSTNGGDPKSAWPSVLDELDLIWVGAKNLGNNSAPSEPVRRAAAIMGAFRMTELYPINPNRIYAMGNSGGSRSAMALGFMRPDFFKGYISDVGIAFPADLPSKFITDELNGDRETYEYISWTSNPANVNSLAHQNNQRFALMSYHSDYRLDETLNCFHLGMRNHGNIAKPLIRPGSHGGSDAGSFRDAIRFLEHPRLLALEDDFSGGNLTARWTDQSASGGSVAQTTSQLAGPAVPVLRLTPGGGSAAVASLEKRPWVDGYGCIVDTAVRPVDSALGGQQLTLAMAANGVGEVRLRIERPDATTQRAVFEHVSIAGAVTSLFQIDIDPADEPLGRNVNDASFFGPAAYTDPLKNFRGLPIRLELWDSSFQVTFGQDLLPGTLTKAAGIYLLEDKRTLTARWSETPASSSDFTARNSQLEIRAGGTDGWLVDQVHWIASAAALPDANTFAVVDGNICNPANWSSGTLPTVETGAITANANWWPGYATNNTSAAANIVNGYQLRVTGGTLGRTANFIPEFKDCLIELRGGNLSNDGPGARVLRLSGTSVITIGAGSTLSADPDQDKIELRSETPTIRVEGGTLDVDDISVSTTTAHPCLVFGSGSGRTEIDTLTLTNIGTYIDFESGSDGVLAVNGANEMFYQNLWSAGSLRVNGASGASFNESFVVSGNELSLATPAKAWQAWVDGHFTPAEQAAGLADEDANPDGDWYPNLIEYALGQSPRDANQSPITNLVGESGISLEFSRIAKGFGVELFGEWSDDLTIWNPADLVVVTPGNPELLRVSSPAAAGPGNRRFIRLVARFK